LAEFWRAFGILRGGGFEHPNPPLGMPLDGGYSADHVSIGKTVIKVGIGIMMVMRGCRISLIPRVLISIMLMNRGKIIFLWNVEGTLHQSLSVQKGMVLQHP
jgi:hypothetical protein